MGNVVHLHGYCSLLRIVGYVVQIYIYMGKRKGKMKDKGQIHNSRPRIQSSIRYHSSILGNGINLATGRTYVFPLITISATLTRPS